MTTKEYQAYCDFIHKVLYELTTIEDYEIILNDIDIPIKSKVNPNWRLLSGCHNVDYNGVGANLNFNISTRTFTCWSFCNCSYNLLTLVEQRFKILGKPLSRFKCLKYICDRLSIPFNFKDDVERDRSNIYNWKAHLSKYLKNSNIEIEDKIYDKSILNYFDKTYRQEWIDFGISIETMEKYGIKWYEYKQQIVIPCYNKNGDLIGIRGRNMNPNVETKYIPICLVDGTEYNFPTRSFMYGENFNSDEISRTKSCILVEAEKSVLKADTWFGNKNTTLALYGHNLTKEKLKYLISLGTQTLYIALDSDFKGIGSTEYDRFEKNVMKIYNQCKPYMKEVYVIYNNLGYDDMYKANCFDFDKERFDKLWESKELIGN